MPHYTYIIKSDSLEKYYTGSTSQDPYVRLYQHNLNHTGFTGKTNDWKIVFIKEVETVTESRSLEKQIK
jgi:putative endonuclease